jgi:pSer/pThr/pTyr-binding forkhead associated (FHA) protein
MAAVDNNGSSKDFHVFSMQDKEKVNPTVEDMSSGGHETNSQFKDIEHTDRMKGLDSENNGDSRVYEESEATMIVDFRAIQSRRTYHRLLALAGDLKNKTYLLDRRQLMIGRDDAADLQIADKSVSKFHALICMKGNKCFLKDLNSRNGVIVNGSPIHEKKLLIDADKIEIGSHLFAFIQGNHTKSFRRKIRQNVKMILSIAGAFICCILMVMMASFFFACEQDQSSTKTVEKKTTQATHDFTTKEKKLDTAQAYYNSADQFSKNRQWEQAMAQYRKALQLDPSFSGIKEAIQHAQFEKSCRDIVKKGNDLIDKDLHYDALNLIKKIPNHSIYYDEVLQQIQTIRDKRSYSVTSTSGTIYKTPSSASEILSIVAKDNVATVILSAGHWHKVLSQSGTMGWMHRDVLKKMGNVSLKSDPPADQKNIQNSLTKEDEGLGLLENSLRYYIVGRMDVSLESLKKALQLDLPNTNPIKVNALASKKAIEDIAKHYANGMKQFKKGRIKKTLGVWEQALASDFNLVGPSDSHLSRDIAMHTADLFYKKAQSAIKRGEKEEAKENCSQAFRAQKEHKGCVEIISSLLNKSS